MGSPVKGLSVLLVEDEYLSALDASEMLSEMGAGSVRVAKTIDGIVIDHADSATDEPNIALHVTDTLMRDISDQRRLASETILFARSLIR